ncbi:MAG: hypothetical protein JRJ66_17365 [Deltaproteobacteria bacterium]|nr:hypothetical protein [Deltaproteobacteria bacterium]
MDCLGQIKSWALKGDAHFEVAVSAITRMIDHRYPTYDKKRRSILQMLYQAIEAIFRHLPCLEDEASAGQQRARVSERTKTSYRHTD